MLEKIPLEKLIGNGDNFPIAFWIFLTLKWQVSELEHFQLFLESYLKVGFLPQTSLFNNNCV